MVAALTGSDALRAQTPATNQRVWSGTWEEHDSWEGSHVVGRSQSQICFVYVQGQDEFALPRWESRRLTWSAKWEDHRFDHVWVEEYGEADERGITSNRSRVDIVTVCNGGGTLELGPSVWAGEYLLTPEQKEQLRPSCVTTYRQREAGPTPPPTQSKRDALDAPSLPNEDQLTGCCAYEKTWPMGTRGAGSMSVSVSAAGIGQSQAACPNLKCNPDLYADYLRKHQAAMELFQHASDLRLKAVYLIAERMGAEFENLRLEGEQDLAGEKAWENFGRHVQRGMRGSRSALSESWVARSAPFAANAWNAIGWIKLLVETTARGWLTAGEWARYQEEAETATRKAEELWRKALADFEAHLKQQPACLAESRKATEEQKKLDRAKQLIEEWENNQVLYRDPINNEALTYEAAIKRAKQLLDSGRISASAWQFITVANASAGKREPNQQALEAAIKELDTAIASFERLDKSITAYLRAQYAIEAKLRSAFGAGSPSSQQPAAG